MLCPYWPYVSNLEVPQPEAEPAHGFRRQAHTSPEKLVTRAASAMMKAVSNWIITNLLAGEALTHMVNYVKNK